MPTKHLWIPGAIIKPIPINPSRDPIIVPVGDVFHIAVSNSESLHDDFERRSDGIESTGYIRLDGRFEQYRPLNVECDAQGDGNSFALDGHRAGLNSWETQGGVPNGVGRWTAPQLTTIKRIIAFKHREFGTPLRLNPAWNAPGFGYHRLFKQWNHNGHSCPGDERVQQFTTIIVPWLNQGAPTEEDDMTPAQAQMLEAAAKDAAEARRLALINHKGLLVNRRAILENRRQAGDDSDALLAEIKALDTETAGVGPDA